MWEGFGTLSEREEGVRRLRAAWGGLVHGRVEANARLFASVFVSLLCVCVCVCCALSMRVCVCELLLLLLLLLFGALLSC